MQINNKPIVVDGLNMVLGHINQSYVTGIRRTSEGILGSPDQIEEVEIFYRDGSSERISILDMDTSEMFVKICSMIATHAALAGEEK